MFANHGLTTGDRVTYTAGTSAIPLAGGGTLSVCGASACREYGAIVVDKDTIRLGERFTPTAADTGGAFPATAGVDAARDVIRFATPHTFVSGDPVRYAAGTGGSILGLNVTYYVRVIDAFTIALHTTSAAATAGALGIAPGQASGDTISSTDHGLNNGDAVTYNAPAPVVFTGQAVNAQPNPSFDKNSPNSQPLLTTCGNLCTNTIFLGRDTNNDGTIDTGHGFNSGDVVDYVTIGSRIVGALGTYYAISVDANTVALADSLCHAGVGTYDPTPGSSNHDDDNTSCTGNIQRLTLTRPSSPGSANDQHALTRRALGGLESGVTYYVRDVSADGDSFKLAASPLAGSPALSVSGTGRNGLHTIRRAGVELTPVSCDKCKHELSIDFQGTAPGGNHALLGPGGVSLRTIHVPAGDGISSATTEGGSGGGITIAVPTSAVTANPDVQAYISGGTTPTVIEAGAGVELNAKSITEGTAYTSNFGIGGVAAGEVDASVDITATTKAYIGADGVRLRAAGALRIQSETVARTVVGSRANSVGFGAGADAESDSRVNLTTDAQIGDGADVEAGSVQLLANVSQVRPRATAWALAGGFVAVAIADADIVTDSTATAKIGAGAKVTGFRGVDVRATHVKIDSAASRTPIPIGFIPIPIPRGGEDNDATATVDTDAGALVVAGVRRDSTAGTTGLVTSSGNIASLALYVQATVGEGDDAGTITWDADVVILGGVNGQPLLVIDENGAIVAQNAVTVTETADAFTVAPIANTGYGNVLFSSSDSIGNGTATGGAANPWPVFEFRDTLASVTIVDHSDKTLRLGSINVVNTLGVEPIVRLTTAGGNTSIQFDLHNSVAPALVEIEKFGNGDVVLTGAITNPTGLTRLYNAQRDISGAVRVTTNLFDGEATAGSLGTAAGRIEVDLVQFVALARPDGPSVDGLRTPVLLAKAGTDIYLSLRGVDRVPAARQAEFGVDADVLTVWIDRASAGRDVDLVLRTAIRQPGSSGSSGVTVAGHHRRLQPDALHALQDARRHVGDARRRRVPGRDGRDRAGQRLPLRAARDPARPHARVRARHDGRPSQGRRRRTASSCCSAPPPRPSRPVSSRAATSASRTARARPTPTGLAADSGAAHTISVEGFTISPTPARAGSTSTSTAR